MNIINEFIDAQELARLHPNTIEIPSDKQLKKLKVRDAKLSQTHCQSLSQSGTFLGYCQEDKV